MTALHDRRGVTGILLDAVGTLIEPYPAVGEVYLAAARRQGVELEIQVVQSRFHRYFRNDEIDETLGPMVTNELLERKRWSRIVASVLAEVPDHELAFEELWQYFAEPYHWRCFADVGDALSEFRNRGFGVRIASNFDGRLRSVVEGLTELVSLKDSLMISSEVGFRKPHPKFYKHACQSLGLPPDSVCSIGDDQENDVNGPERAGLSAILVQRQKKSESNGQRCSTLLDAVALLRPIPLQTEPNP